MVQIEQWLSANWFSLLQGAGIICGLFFTAISIRRDTKARQAANLLTFTQQHRDLWAEFRKRSAELGRITKSEYDPIGAPITAEEEEFLNAAFVHNYTGWLLSKQGSLALIPMDAIRADIHHFFRLPIPNAVWLRTKAYRDPKFVRFVDRVLRKRK